MNVLKRELKVGRKAFILWSIGLFFVMFAGMAKYTGFNGDTSVMALFDTMPKIVLAVFGMVGVDVTTLGGFYAMLIFYAIICAAIYGVQLGSNAVNREVIDKTYEFIFTKPRARSYLLNIKLLAAIIYITLFSILNYIFSIAALSTLEIENTIVTAVILYTIAMWLISVLFYMIAIFIGAIISKVEKAILYSNLLVVGAFVCSVAYDMFDNVRILRFFTPLKYFEVNEVLNNNLNIIFVIICIVLSIVLYLFALRKFDKKDLHA